MRKEKRPFVVEVKRGAKRSPPPEDKSFEDAIIRAESALFGVDGDNGVVEDVASVSVSTAEPAPPRRILEALPTDPLVVEDRVDEVLPKRRGRKPGSKNRPRSAEARPVKRRGRPAKAAGGAVRSVPPTPEIVNAALSHIARATPAQTAPTEARTMSESEAQAAPPVKRGRGRPRKIVQPGDLSPRVPQWVTWLQTPDDETPRDLVKAPTQPAPAAAEAARSLRPYELQLLHPAALVAGMRWTRRLRGGAAAVVMRRARKV